MKKFLFILFGLLAFSGAFAAGENVPTSKSYVDAVVAQKQDKISANIIMPAGYTRLEYLASTGPQYINTGVQTSSTQRIEYDVRLDHVMSNGETQILGAGGDTVGTLYSFRFEPGANIKIYYKPGGNIDTNIPQDTNRHRLILDLKNKFASVDGTTFNFSSLPSGQTYSQYLFAYSRKGTVDTQYGFKGKMYGAKIYDNGVLVRNFIPARRDSDNVVGMYDTISGQFFTNSGTGEFIAGPVIIPDIQVLTNTGTAGEIGAKGIYDANGEYATQQNNLVDAVTMNTAVQNAIDSEFQCVEWDEHGECLLLQLGGISEIASGYTRLEYIESTGTQWIEVQYFANPNTKVYADFQLTNLLQMDKFIFIADWTPLCFAAMFGSAAKFAYCAWDDGRTNDLVFSNQLADLNRHQFIISAQNKLESWSMIDFNLKTRSNKTVADLNASKSSDLRFHLFGYDNKNVSMKLYSFKIWDNDSLVRNFIPARRDSDGEIGMYDTISGQFFTNSGTGEFIAGPVAGSVVYLPQGD